MVHALQLAHGFLRPQGLLTGIHDIPAPHLIEVCSPETVHRVGWLSDQTGFGNTPSALNALAEVVADGCFILQDERDFGYKVYVDGLDELKEWLPEWWESALLTDRTRQRIEEPLQDPGQSARILIVPRARITRLKASDH
jgi:hypothetical protein